MAESLDLNQERADLGEKVAINASQKYLDKEVEDIVEAEEDYNESLTDYMIARRNLKALRGLCSS